MKVVILCGGQGTRLREETEYKPISTVTEFQIKRSMKDSLLEHTISA